MQGGGLGEAGGVGELRRGAVRGGGGGGGAEGLHGVERQPKKVNVVLTISKVSYILKYL